MSKRKRVSRNEDRLEPFWEESEDFYGEWEPLDEEEDVADEPSTFLKERERGQRRREARRRDHKYDDSPPWKRRFG